MGTFKSLLSAVQIRVLCCIYSGMCFLLVWTEHKTATWAWTQEPPPPNAHLAVFHRMSLVTEEHPCVKFFFKNISIKGQAYPPKPFIPLLDHKCTFGII